MQIGVVATPADVAQEVVDLLVSAGVTGVLNFAPCVLSVPPGVMVRRVDLSTELQILAFHEQRRAAGGLAAGPEALAEVARSTANGSNGSAGRVNGNHVSRARAANGHVQAALARDIAGAAG